MIGRIQRPRSVPSPRCLPPPFRHNHTRALFWSPMVTRCAGDCNARKGCGVRGSWEARPSPFPPPGGSSQRTLNGQAHSLSWGTLPRRKPHASRPTPRLSCVCLTRQMLNAAPSPLLERVTPRRSSSPFAEELGGLHQGPAFRLGKEVRGGSPIAGRPAPTAAAEVRVPISAFSLLAYTGVWCGVAERSGWRAVGLSDRGKLCPEG